jgi:hypothetical protein
MQLTASNVRPIASTTTRFLFSAGIGASLSIGIAQWADHHFHQMPDANGKSPNRIDRVEARHIFSGTEGFPALVGFGALLSASILYTRMREVVSPTEYSFVRNVGYAGFGGLLAGTLAAPSILPPLPTTSGTTPPMNAVQGATQTVTGAVTNSVNLVRGEASNPQGPAATVVAAGVH